MASDPIKAPQNAAAPGAALPWARPAPECAEPASHNASQESSDATQQPCRKRDATEANLDDTDARSPVQGSVEGNAMRTTETEVNLARSVVTHHNHLMPL
eukprot:1181708-Prorocentrum_minimum.AAC.3